MKNETLRKLCVALLILMGLDLILTIIGVGYMDMIELNPLYTIVGMPTFILFKTVLFGIPVVLFYLFKDKTYPAIDTKAFFIPIIHCNKIDLTKICIVSICIFLNTLYGLVVLNNVYQIEGELI